jgi:hypothetical protein
MCQQRPANAKRAIAKRTQNRAEKWELATIRFVKSGENLHQRRLADTIVAKNRKTSPLTSRIHASRGAVIRPKGFEMRAAARLTVEAVGSCGYFPRNNARYVLDKSSTG